MKRGIDVSAWQGEIDWNAVRTDHVEFAILRAYAGQPDRTFAENYRQATGAGLPVGAYLYSYARTPEAAEAEADALMEVLGDRTFAYPVFFDMEDKTQVALAKERVQEIAGAFLRRMEAAGYFVGLYSYKSFLETNFTAEFLRRYAVWVAHTGVTATNYAHPFGIWQYSHSGTVAGVRGAVDWNVAYRDFPTEIRTAGKNHFAATETSASPVLCAYPVPTTPQRRGSRGDAVRWLQCQLIQRGFSCGPEGVDGSFGPATEAAVRAYQTANGLEPDAVCGPLTRGSLLQNAKP